MELREIEQEKITAPEMPARVAIDEGGIAELAESIRELGLLQPLVVQERNGVYEVIAGHRRLLATRQLGMPSVHCLVADPNTGDQMMAARLHENLIRVDLTPLEEAAMYAQLYELVEDTNKVAALTRRSRDVVESRLELLNCDDAVREALASGQIAAGAAIELNKVENEQTRHWLLGFAVQQGATVNTVRMWRKQYAHLEMPANDGGPPPEVANPENMHQTDPNICWLCGSGEDPHDLRIRMMHSTCERMLRRQAEQKAAAEAGNGNG